MRFSRTSGVLLHITSLPSEFGIGDLGPAAFEFVDFLDRSGQTVWQILPICPTIKGNSPYSSYSAFAGNPLLISPQRLVQEGWLSPEILSDLKSSEAEQLNAGHVNFDLVSLNKSRLLHQAFEQSRERLSQDLEFKLYCSAHAHWLDDLARFESIMKHMAEPDWTRWPSQLVRRDRSALDEIERELKVQIEFSKFKQYVFDQQWAELKNYANLKGIRMFGDMPIFVAHESADVWANQSLFLLDESGQPLAMAGVPPDYFSATGQLWGNPLYRWETMETNQFAWWTARFRRALQQLDWLRVDHFRGFESYWKIPAGEETAVNGTWEPGPQERPFLAAERELGELPIIAEDLGLITPEVHALRKLLGFPSMRVLQFGYDDPEDVFHRCDNFPPDCAAYTGTHDNETLMGWFQRRENNDSIDGNVNALLNLSSESCLPIHFQLIEMVMNSAADIAIFPLQDALGLGNDARMNTPGLAEDNWAWRVTPEQLSDSIAHELKSLAIAANR
ncbi:MAG: 4-alpha-glucanotransferase [Mariniblastus sp.]|jgi:4-alpha-glucanotransferase